MGGRRVDPVVAFLVGPTGVGKTDVAIHVARALGAEIVGVDSRQVYKRLEKGTAKPTFGQRQAVRHHLLDCLDPEEPSSAGRFVELFRAVLEDLRDRRVPGLAVGGAGLYVDACLGRLHPLPGKDPAFRARAEERERRGGPGTLHRELAAVDPGTAARLSPRDLQRTVRALEIVEKTGAPLAVSFRGSGLAVCPADTPLVALRRVRADLYARIEERCAAMVEDGLPEEVRALLASGLSETSPGLKTLGYREWIAWVRGGGNEEEVLRQLVRNTRRYAKRQETWFRNRHPRRTEILVPASEAPEETARRVLLELRGDAGDIEA
jgi:tRNA dimethylallyltransferase